MRRRSYAWLRDQLRGARQPRPGEYEIDCPMCSERIGKADCTQNLGINLEKGVFHCWRCGWGGKLTSLLRDAHKIAERVSLPRVDLTKLREHLAPAPPLDYPEDALPRGYVEVRPEACGIWAGRVLRYLRGRGLSDAQIARLHPGYTLSPPRSGEVDCRGRVVLPVVMGGRVIYYVARTMGDAQPKTLNPRLGGMPKPLWGLDDAKPGGRIVLTEGIFDALAAPDGVAMLGDRLTRAQAFLLLTRAPRSVVVLGDGDDAGRAGAQRAALKLLETLPIDVRWAATPDGTDPGDYCSRPAELRRIIADARRPSFARALLSMAGRFR